MPKNIIIFYHYDEIKLGDVLLKLLKSFYKNGFDTICTEVDATQTITSAMISDAFKAKKQLKETLERDLNFRYANFNTINIVELLTSFNSLPYADQIDPRIVLTAGGELNMLNTFKQALSIGFKIVGIDDCNVSTMSTFSAELLNAAREEAHFKNLYQLNNQGKNCITLLGASHFIRMRNKIASLPVEEQANFKLMYLYTDFLLLDELKEEAWYKMRTNPTEFSNGPVPIHSFKISTVQQQEELTAWLKQQNLILSIPEQPSFWNKQTLVKGSLFVAAVGLGLYACHRALSNDVNDAPVQKPML